MVPLHRSPRDPTVATDAAQATLWTNRFEPFGTDPWAGTNLGALKNEMYLRFPGQWEDEVWQDAMLGAEGYYNVNRWYQPETGTYSSVDPLSEDSSNTLDAYRYAESSPVMYIDPIGLLSCKCSDDCPGGEWTINLFGGTIGAGGGISKSRGTYSCISRDVHVPVTITCGLLGPILTIGLGFEGATPFLPSTCACNAEGLLGRQTSILGSAGPFSANVSGCGKEPFSIGDRTLNVGIGKSFGAGLAWVSCKVKRRGDN